LKDNGKGPIKKIFENSYNKVLAPRHPFLVRKDVWRALSFSSAGNIEYCVNLIFWYPKYDNEARKAIRETIKFMKKIWNGVYEYYKKYKMLDLE